MRRWLASLVFSLIAVPAIAQTPLPFSQLPQLGGPLLPNDLVTICRAGTLCPELMLGSNFLLPQNNLSDIPNPAIARANLGLGSAVGLNLGTSVNNPGTGTLEAVLPLQTITGANRIFVTADLFKKTRRSNSGTAMTDTLPASTATGMANGTRVDIANVDASATDTLTAGAGTTITAGCAAVGPGRDVMLVYDAPNTIWRGDANTCNSVLAIGGALLGVPNTSITNAMLANPATTVNGQTCTLGATCTISGGGGSVVSVSLSVPGSSIFGVTGSPITTSGTLGLTTTGTSGGIPYFSSTSQLASSALLASNAFIVGGGAGAAPNAVAITGLVLGNGASAPTAYGGTSDAGNVLTALSAAGAGSFLPYTNADTASTLVERDASGNFAAGTITASLTGGASLDLPLAGGTMTGTFTGKDSGTWGTGGINGSIIGGTTPEAGTFTGLTATGSFTATGLVTNADLANPATTVNGQTCTLGSTCTVTAATSSLVPGTTTVTGTANELLFQSASGGLLGQIATADNAVLGTNGSGVPSFSATLPSGLSAPNFTVTSTFTAIGLVTNADLANSTISGIALGNNLDALTATDGSLTFSGSYTGAAARTVGCTTATSSQLGCSSPDNVTIKASTGVYAAQYPTSGDLMLSAGNGAVPTAYAGTSSAGNVVTALSATGVGSFLAYTNADTASTLVERDSSGNFSAGTIAASLTGHSSLDCALTGCTITGALTVSGSGGITVSSGSVGIGTTGPASQLTVSGAGQATGSFSTTGALGGTLEVDDTDDLVGSGGAIVFSANTQAWKFAAIKGYVTDGTSNSRGDITFSVRLVDTDAALTEAMRIQSNGNVGIGTASPSYLLDVNGVVRMAANSLENGNYIAAFSGSFTNGHCLEYGGTANTIIDAGFACGSGGGGGSVTSVGLSVPGSSIFGVSGSPITSAGSLSITTTGTSGGIPYFSSSSIISSSALLGSGYIVIGGGAGSAPYATSSLYWNNTSGALGIGTASPSSQLTISGAGQTTGNFATAGSLAGVLEVDDTDDLVGSGGAIVFSANTQAWKFAAIKGYVTDGTSNSRGDITFSVRLVDTDAALTEAMRIQSSGNVGIGTVSPSQLLEVNGISQFDNEMIIAKISDPNTDPGAGYVKMTAEAGTLAGTCKIVIRAGTSATPVTLIDNIGSGC